MYSRVPNKQIGRLLENEEEKNPTYTYLFAMSTKLRRIQITTINFQLINPAKMEFSWFPVIYQPRKLSSLEQALCSMSGTM